MWLKPAIFCIRKPSAEADGNVSVGFSFVKGSEASMIAEADGNVSDGFSQRLYAKAKQGFSQK